MDDDEPRALVERGTALAEEGDLEQALLVFEEVFARVGDNDDPSMREVIAEALNGRANALIDLKRLEAALATLDQLIAVYGGLGGSDLHADVAAARHNRGIALSLLKRYDESLQAFDDCIRFLESVGEEEPVSWPEAIIAAAIRGKANVLGDTKRFDDAVALYTEVTRTFGASEDEETRLEVARAYVGKGSDLLELREYAEALSVADQVVERYGDETDSALLEQVSLALMIRVSAFGRLKREASVYEALDEMAERFGDHEDEELRCDAARALFIKGDALLETRHPRQALSVYEDLVTRFENDGYKPIVDLVEQAQLKIEVIPASLHVMTAWLMITGVGFSALAIRLLTKDVATYWPYFTASAIAGAAVFGGLFWFETLEPPQIPRWTQQRWIPYLLIAQVIALPVVLLLAGTTVQVTYAAFAAGFTVPSLGEYMTWRIRRRSDAP